MSKMMLFFALAGSQRDDEPKPPPVPMTEAELVVQTYALIGLGVFFVLAFLFAWLYIEGYIFRDRDKSPRIPPPPK